MVSFFNGISTFVGYLMPKPSFEKNRSGTIQPIAERIRGLILFPRAFARKMNVIARLEFELGYYDSAVHCFDHYTTSIPTSFS